MPPASSSDRNLLFGLLALQMEFVSQQQLIEAMNAWLLEKQTPLGDILVRRGSMDGDDRASVEQLVKRRLERHGGDARASLAAVRVGPDVRASLAGLGDDVRQSLVAATEGPTVDPQAGAPAGQARPLDALRYSRIREHARGGLGEVHVARDEELGREVALKEIQERFADHPESRARFVREAEITGHLEHPGVVPVYGLGVYTDGRPYYAMRFIHGEAMQDSIAQFHKADEGRRDPGERSLALRGLLTRFIAVCDAVAYAHSRGVIHRDLKPANVMLGEYGETLVIDWGLARLVAEEDPTATTARYPVPLSGGSGTATELGRAVGTPAFMPPEQARGEHDKMGPKSDVFSLGAILYELLTGGAPYQGTNLAEVLEQARKGDVIPARRRKPGVPHALEAVCAVAMAALPERRYASAGALAADVQRWLGDEPVSTYPDPLRVRAARWVRKHKTLVTAAAVALVVALAALGAGLVQATAAAEREHKERLAAEANFEKAVRAAELVSDELANGIRPIAGTQSKTVAAILSRAEAVYDDLLDSPTPPARARAGKAKMLVLTSDVYHGMNRATVAADRASAAIDLYQGLLAEEPDSRTHKTGLAKAYQRRGQARTHLGTDTKALADFDESIRLCDELIDTDESAPGEAFVLAGSLTLRGNVLRDFGAIGESKASYERGTRLRERLLAKSPADAYYRGHVAVSYRMYGRFLVEAGDETTGATLLRRAVELDDAGFAANRSSPGAALDDLRALNQLAFYELGTDRAAAIVGLKKAADLAELFARRDPDHKEWERESLRAKWTLGEIEKQDWPRMTPQQRAASIRRQIALLDEILRIADKRLAGEPDAGVWLADRANISGRLATAHIELAEVGGERRANLKRALGFADQAIAVGARLLEIEPRSHESALNLIFASGEAARAAVALRPDADALRRHWVYRVASMRHYQPLHLRYPENLKVAGEHRASVARGITLVPFAFGTAWPEHATDAKTTEPLFDFLEALPDPATVTDPGTPDDLTAARAAGVAALTQFAEQEPLPQRGKALLESLKPRTPRPPAEELAHWRNQQGVWRKLFDDWPTNTRYEMRVASLHRKVASVLEDAGTLAEALAEREKELATWKKIAGVKPKDGLVRDRVEQTQARIAALRARIDEAKR